MKFGNDPRNVYDKYYTSYDDDVVVEGERNGFYNTTMDNIAQMCINSIVDNTPVEFDCDVCQYLNPDEDLLDTNCYDYNLVFKTSFNKMNKKEMMSCLESYANHAMVLVGVDLDANNKPIKWKVENSWGRSDDPNDNGYYTMSHEWFEKFVYNVVIQTKYVSSDLVERYNKSYANPVVLPEDDIMS